jgi:SAM-dependent methyltransferase
MADDPSYIHGYTRPEQERLVSQAEFWRDTVILPGLDCRAGQSLLEVGCGAGAVLGVLGAAFPGLRLAGIDRAAEQLAFARDHLQRLALDADLRQGDAGQLPWEERRFDHVFMMWILEHVTDARPLLAEARRVLRPGGTITIIETDYSMAHAFPPHPAHDDLMEAQRALFRRSGNALMGRSVGALLNAAGFHEVKSAPAGFHYFTGQPGDPLRDFVDYLLGFLEPMVPLMAAELGLDRARLGEGIAFMRALPERPEASITQIVFRATARR